MMIVTNGRIVTEDAVLEGYDLVVEGNRIAGIVPHRAVPRTATCIDAAGGWIMPGFIDIHADYIEHMVAPRPTAVMDLELAIREAERELLTHGITTMFHSLSFFASSEFGRGPTRDPDITRRFADLIESAHRRRHLIRHRFHARFEIDSLDRVEELEGYLRSGTVHLISFMDHTPGQGQYRDLEVYRATLKAWRGMRDEEVDESIRTSRSRQKMTLDHIRAVAALAAEYGVAVASHDDDSTEKIHLVLSMGATISEFPTTMEVAREARGLGLHVVAGAPNVLLGGSHSGNLSAAEAVLEGCADVLCSDYFPAAMLHAVFALSGAHCASLPQLVKLVTLHPAQAVMMDKDYGSLVAGKIADFVIVGMLDREFPVITHAVVDGVRVLNLAYREGAR